MQNDQLCEMRPYPGSTHGGSDSHRNNRKCSRDERRELVTRRIGIPAGGHPFHSHLHRDWFAGGGET